MINNMRKTVNLTGSGYTLSDPKHDGNKDISANCVAILPYVGKYAWTKLFTEEW